MTPQELDDIEDRFRLAGKKTGGLLETFFYRDVPKLISALRESAQPEDTEATEGSPLQPDHPGLLFGPALPSFQCPNCKGKTFGTIFSGPNCTGLATRICHDQFETGCEWRGPDSECMTRPASETEDVA